jgi:adenine/guanine phosphoribosyltransferase-like PRPP-binding protein|tara:strand:- start:1902 stop:2063 length:162 start_codon:yes stop_codon:yes gene_type:complete
MDTLISAGSFMGAGIAYASFFLDNASWEIIVTFAGGGLLFGFILAKLINKKIN